MTIPDKMLLLCLVVLAPAYIPIIYKVFCITGEQSWFIFLSLVKKNQRQYKLISAKLNDYRIGEKADTVYFLTGAVTIYLLFALVNMFV